MAVDPRLKAFESLARSQGYSEEEILPFMDLASSAQEMQQGEVSQYAQDVASGLPLNMVPEKIRSDVYRQALPLTQEQAYDPDQDDVLQRDLYRKRIYSSVEDAQKQQDVSRDVNLYNQGALEWDELSNDAKEVLVQQGVVPQEEESSIQAYVQMVEQGDIKNLENIPESVRNEVVKALSKQGVSTGEISKEKEGETVAGVLGNLKDVYYGDKGISRFPIFNDDLAKGRLQGTANRIGSFLGFAPRVNVYGSTREGLAGSLKGAVGESGRLTDKDIDRIVNLLPSAISTRQEAKLKWDQIDNLLKSKYGITLDDTGMDINNATQGEGTTEDLMSKYWD